ncbi:hypothetical protein GCM10023094_24660 [Rhodococcus olei]|uniref:RiboL-PSP-HEPN domain-containing protein n=1 Tax=Rhodococcus olei TaxID=2161675 RepID=A0ABP8P0M0_9NOCA
MTSQLDVPLDDFLNDLGRAERLLRLISEFRTFGASAASHVGEGNQSDPHWDEAKKLGETAQVVRQDLPVLAGALHLYICGRFEYFVRELVVSVSDLLSGTAERYMDLPKKLRDELFALTLTVAQNPSRYGYRPEETESFLIALAAGLSDGQGSVEIKSEVLAITEANMNPRVLADVLKRVGINSIWSDLGKQARFKTHLGVRSDGDCTKEAEGRLAKIMRDRNSFAHPTSSTEFPDVDQVLDSCSFFRVLSEVIVDIAKLPPGKD